MNVKNPIEQSQFHDFTNLHCTFSDIDGIHITDKYVILLEGKFGTASKINETQKAIFQRIADSFKQPAIYIHYQHNTPAPLIVDVSQAKVIEYLYNGKWITTEIGLNQLIKHFINAKDKRPE